MSENTQHAGTEEVWVRLGRSPHDYRKTLVFRDAEGGLRTKDGAYVADLRGMVPPEELAGSMDPRGLRDSGECLENRKYVDKNMALAKKDGHVTHGVAYYGQPHKGPSFHGRAYFTLFREPHHTDADIEDARNALYRDGGNVWVRGKTQVRFPTKHLHIRRSSQSSDEEPTNYPPTPDQIAKHMDE